MAEHTPLKEAASCAIDQAKEKLHDVCREIWNHPELMFEERRAHSLLTNLIEGEGFVVERQFVSETGFRATYGDTNNGPHVVIFSEYDALPDIGHACGHNLISISGLAVVIGVKAAMVEAGKPFGKISLLGSPAEEGGGGKIEFINACALNDVDVAMMVHPANSTTAMPQIFALLEAIYKFHGKAAHAAVSPWEGNNALDAAVMAYENISCLRQQIKPTNRIHGIFVNGGAKPNIIPEYTELLFYIRASTHAELVEMREKVTNCFKGAAEATGCRLEYEYHENIYYRDVVSNIPLAKTYEKNAVGLGVKFDKAEIVNSRLTGGSTDMGNVSYEVPSIHPMFNIGTDSSLHTREFQAAAGKQEAFEATIMQAKALAFTALDVYTTPTLLDQIKSAFQEDPKLKQ